MIMLSTCFLSWSSTIISWGRSREKEAFERVLDQFSSGPVSVVSDSYDIFNACKHIWGDKLKERVMERSQDSCLVIRPDSGDPAETLVEVNNETGFVIVGQLKMLQDLCHRLQIFCGHLSYEMQKLSCRLLKVTGTSEMCHHLIYVIVFIWNSFPFTKKDSTPKQERKKKQLKLKWVWPVTGAITYIHKSFRGCVCFTGHQDFRGVFWLLSELSGIQGASFVPENYPRRRHRPQLSGRGQRMFGCFTHFITAIFHTCYLTFVGFKIDGQKVDNVSELSTSPYRRWWLKCNSLRPMFRLCSD